MRETDQIRPVRAIYIAGVNKWVPISAYVRQIKICKTNPDAEFKHGLTSWWPCTGAEIMRQFRRGMHERINEGIPYNQRGQEMVSDVDDRGLPPV